MNAAKLYLLNLVLENKHILFGKPTVVTSELKTSKWKEMASHAFDLGILDGRKDWRYLRDTVWQNWRKRTSDKVENGMRTNGGRGKMCKWDKCDEVILEILGRNIPKINMEPSLEYFLNDHDVSEATEEVLEIEYNNIDEPPSEKKIKIEEMDEKVSTLEDMEREILKAKLKILERDCYLKDLEIYRNENELGLCPSRFTQAFYNSRKRLHDDHDDDDENILS